MSNPTVVHIDPQMSRDSDSIRVFVRDCKVALHIGCKPEERLKPQIIVVNIEVERVVPSHPRYLAETRFEDVIDYSRLVRFITEDLPRLGQISFLEVVAETIASFCFEDGRIQKVRVHLDKPEIYGEKALVGIEMCRTRPGVSS